MVTSTWASNLMWVLLGINWVFEGRWREKWEMVRHGRLLQALLVLSALYVVGMLWTSDIATGLRELEQKLPLLVVPLVLLTTRPLHGNSRRVVLALYMGTVVVVSIIGATRLLTIEGLPYREAVPYISHIRFGLNCCMVIYLCLAGLRETTGWGLKVALCIVVIWLLVFLMMIRSYTAFAILIVVSTVIVLAYHHHWYTYVLWGAGLVAIGGIVLYEVNSYYRMSSMATGPLAATTVNGRPYQHSRDGMVENGNYINNYICTEELEQEWAQRSSMDIYAITQNGYPVMPALIRYLNGLGLTKDSAGVAQLTDGQIGEIERGVANPVYEHGWAVKKMVYTMLFERECNRHGNSVQGFTMLQRFEYWSATLDIIK